MGGGGLGGAGRKRSCLKFGAENCCIPKEARSIHSEGGGGGGKRNSKAALIRPRVLQSDK